MTVYQGSCHCGQVQFTVNTIIDKVISCNCSICTKKGVLHHRVEPEQFSITRGEEFLSLYQFGSEQAKHYFCKQCGIHAFCNPRSAPNMYAVNIRCLDNFDLATATYELVTLDGRNWEQAVNSLNETLRSTAVSSPKE